MVSLRCRSGKGPQFIRNIFEGTCLGLNIKSFSSILEEECLSRHEFVSYAEAYATVVDFICSYNANRIHSATKYLPPLECYQLVKDNQLELKPVKV